MAQHKTNVRANVEPLVLQMFADMLSPACRSMSVGGVTFALEQQSKDPQSVVYAGQYNTDGVAHTKSGERQPVQISIEV